MTIKENELPPLVSVTQAAEVLGMDRKIIFRLIRTNKLASQRMGWMHFIDREDLPKIREMVQSSSPA